MILLIAVAAIIAAVFGSKLGIYVLLGIGGVVVLIWLIAWLFEDVDRSY